MCFGCIDALRVRIARDDFRSRGTPQGLFSAERVRPEVSPTSRCGSVAVGRTDIVEKLRGRHRNAISRRDDRIMPPTQSPTLLWQLHHRRRDARVCCRLAPNGTTSFHVLVTYSAGGVSHQTMFTSRDVAVLYAVRLAWKLRCFGWVPQMDGPTSPHPPTASAPFKLPPSPRRACPTPTDRSIGHALHNAVRVLAVHYGLLDV